MKKLFPLLLLSMTLYHCQEERPVYNSLEEYPIYAFDDLGAIYTPEATTFKLWSPAADAARLKLYTTDEPTEAARETLDMEEVDGAWTVGAPGDLDGVYYTFQIKQNGNWNAEATDPYARTAGTNGLRGQVVDLTETNPEGWGYRRKARPGRPDGRGHLRTARARRKYGRTLRDRA